ncbi:MAG: hypothetical protein MUC41_09745 [Syntrophobacteraceae bacterium]|nr:hypothetical protein [Syntrophobacteraceae bacterium]
MQNMPRGTRVAVLRRRCIVERCEGTASLDRWLSHPASKALLSSALPAFLR